ncbi:MAG: PQQ-binding-like beta-propeller repeat protein [Planctomycetia bacterium]|nr:PQQ-binding-like beta-propeller repeat protein [Planctomycetia bacterium]
MIRFLPVVLLAILFSPAFVSGNWPVSRGDATMTGTATAKLPDQLEEKWTFKTGDTIESAPAIVDAVVYVSSLDKHLYAIELATGKQKWKVKLGLMKASPSVKGDRVYVGNLDGMFYCLKTADGSKVWEFETAGEITAGCNFHGNNILIGSHDSTLYCLDEKGKKVWEVKTEGPVNGAPAVIGDVTFVAGCDSSLHILDAKTGKELGLVELGGEAAATAAVANDMAYVGTMANTVVAVDLKKKAKVWTYEAPARQQPFYASAAASDLVVAASRDKKVYGLDPKSGKAMWNFLTDGQVDASPVVVGGRVFVGCLSNDGNFYVLDLKSGKKLQELNLDSAVTGSVGVGPDCIVVGTDKGTIYCLGKK